MNKSKIIIAILSLFFTLSHASEIKISELIGSLKPKEENKDANAPGLLKSLESQKVSEKAKAIMLDIDKETKENIASNVAKVMEIQDLDPKLIAELEEAINNTITPELTKYFLYLTSKSIPNSAVKNFLYGIDKLNSKGFKIQGRVVYNGFSKTLNPKEFMDDLNVTSVKHSKININPFIFEDLHINAVPALVVAKCPVKFRSSDCHYEYIIKGEIPMEKSLSILNDKDAEYKDMYFSFIAPE